MHTQKEKYRAISLINRDTKIHDEILPNGIQKYIKRIIHHNQVGRFNSPIIDQHNLPY